MGKLFSTKKPATWVPKEKKTENKCVSYTSKSNPCDSRPKRGARTDEACKGKKKKRRSNGA